MQKILTQLIKKELPRVLQWCSMSADQGTYLGKSSEQPLCHQYDNFAAVARQCLDDLFISRLQLLRYSMFHQLMLIRTFLCNSTEK